MGQARAVLSIKDSDARGQDSSVIGRELYR